MGKQNSITITARIHARIYKTHKSQDSVQVQVSALIYQRISIHICVPLYRNLEQEAPKGLGEPF